MRVLKNKSQVTILLKFLDFWKKVHGRLFNAVKDFNPSSIVQIHSTLLGSFWLMEVNVCVNNCCYTEFHA